MEQRSGTDDRERTRMERKMAALAAQTSQLYGTNVVNLLTLLTPGKDGVLTLDMDDVVQRGITVTRSSEGGGA